MSLQEIEDSLTRSLTTITTHWDHMLTPPSSGSIARGSGGAVTLADDHSDTETDTPRLERLLSLRREVTEGLVSWVRVVMDDRNVRPMIRCTHGRTDLDRCTTRRPWATEKAANGWRTFVGEHAIDIDDIHEVVTFLETNAQWLSGHDAADAAADEMRAWAARVKATVDPPRKDWVNIGTCPTTTDDTVCGAKVRAYTGKDTITCTRCGTEGDIAWWEHVILPDTSRLLTAAELPEFVRQQFGKTIKAPTVRKWIERHVITSAGTDEKGRTLYDKGAVAYALTRRQMAL